MGDLICVVGVVSCCLGSERDGRESEDGVIRLPAIFRYLSRFGGKKFKIEIDSSIWREEIQNRNRLLDHPPATHHHHHHHPHHVITIITHHHTSMVNGLLSSIKSTNLRITTSPIAAPLSSLIVLNKNNNVILTRN